MSRVSFLLRAVFLIGFIAAMPILALPSVARRLDDFLYGHQPSPLAAALSLEEQEGDGIAQATFEVPSSDAQPAQQADDPRGLDGATVVPPPLAEGPDFPPPAAETAADASAVPGEADLNLTFDPQAFTSFAQEIHGIRQRLEDLGADLVLLEEDEASSNYRFHCRMLVSAGSEETKSFEATGPNAAAVARQVLQTVEAWRTSQIAPVR